MALCVFTFTEKPVGSVVRKAAGYVIAEGMRFAFVDRVMHSITTAAQLDKEKPNARFSDGTVDPPGRSFAGHFILPTFHPPCLGTMGIELPPAVVEKKQGSLYTIYPDRLSFRPDDGSGVYRAEPDEGIPDGMSIDPEGICGSPATMEEEI